MMNSTAITATRIPGPDDLLVLARELDLDTAMVVVGSSIGLDGIVSMTHAEQARAYDFLCMSPEQREDEISLHDDEEAVMLILRARWMGLRSEKLNELVDDLCEGRDISFRETVVNGALAGDVLDGFPSMQQIISHSL